MSERIKLTIEQDIAQVLLDRPEKMNALDGAMFDALIEVGRSLIEQPGLRAVVMSGAGRAFCAGLDMSRFESMAETSDRAKAPLADQLRLGPRTHGLCNGPQYAALVWQDIPVPVIAALHGVVFGGGLQIALGADLRFVAPDTKLSVLEVKWGLVPYMGGMERMRHLVRADLMRDLTFSGRIFSGEEAFSLGLATRVCADPYQAAMAYAGELAGRSPDSIRAAKRLLRLAETADTAALLQAESDEQIALLGSANQVEAVRANHEQRAPEFVMSRH